MTQYENSFSLGKNHKRKAPKRSAKHRMYPKRKSNKKHILEDAKFANEDTVFIPQLETSIPSMSLVYSNDKITSQLPPLAERFPFPSSRPSFKAIPSLYQTSTSISHTPTNGMNSNYSKNISQIWAESCNVTQLFSDEETSSNVLQFMYNLEMPKEEAMEKMIAFLDRKIVKSLAENFLDCHSNSPTNSTIFLMALDPTPQDAINEAEFCEPDNTLHYCTVIHSMFTVFPSIQNRGFEEMMLYIQESMKNGIFNVPVDSVTVTFRKSGISHAFLTNEDDSGSSLAANKFTLIAISSLLVFVLVSATFFRPRTYFKKRPENSLDTNWCSASPTPWRQNTLSFSDDEQSIFLEGNLFESILSGSRSIISIFGSHSISTFSSVKHDDSSLSSEEVESYDVKLT